MISSSEADTWAELVEQELEVEARLEFEEVLSSAILTRGYKVNLINKN